MTTDREIAYAQRMKSLKKSLLTVIVVFFALVLVYGFTEGNLYYLFLFPVLALSFFLFFYLYRQSQTDEQERIKKSAQYAKDDKEAEKWIETSLAPDTLRLIKRKRSAVIIYSSIFFLVIFFLWNYLSNDLSIAIRNTAYAGGLFGLFLLYIMTVPYLFQWIHKLIPQRLRRFINGDWERGYIFLLPITFTLYILYPFTNILTELINKLASFPVFFLVYTSFFICTYCIMYMYYDIHKEDDKLLKKEVKKMIEE